MGENVLPPDDARASETPTDQRPIVAAAVASLKAFGVDLERESAAIMLPFWAHFWKLSAPEVEAVLGAFPIGDPPDTTETGRAARGGGWISGASAGGDR
jgi:hypothetical protein